MEGFFEAAVLAVVRLEGILANKGRQEKEKTRSPNS